MKQLEIAHRVSYFLSVQSDRRDSRVWTEVCVLLRTIGQYCVSLIQVSVNGSVADTRVRLACVCGAASTSGVLRWWFHVYLMRVVARRQTSCDSHRNKCTYMIDENVIVSHLAKL